MVYASMHYSYFSGLFDTASSSSKVHHIYYKFIANVMQFKNNCALLWNQPSQAIYGISGIISHDGCVMLLYACWAIARHAWKDCKNLLKWMDIIQRFSCWGLWVQVQRWLCKLGEGIILVIHILIFSSVYDFNLGNEWRRSVGHLTTGNLHKCSLLFFICK